MKINIISCAAVLACTALLGACEDPRQNQSNQTGSGGGGYNAYSPARVDNNSTGSGGGATSHDSWIDASKADSATLDDNRVRRNILFVYDCSASMNENSNGEQRFVAARKAIQSFVSAIPEDNNLGLVAFVNGTVRQFVPLGLSNRVKFMSEINQMNPNGGTPLHSAISMGYEKLQEQGLKQLGYGEYVLVVVTDGEANAGEDPRGIVGKILNESPVTVYTIGFDIKGNHSLNQPGRTVYKEARNRQELEAALRAVAVEEEQFVPITTFQQGN